MVFLFKVTGGTVQHSQFSLDRILPKAHWMLRDGQWDGLGGEGEIKKASDSSRLNSD
jgi:hypothetical protein